MPQCVFDMQETMRITAYLLFLLNGVNVTILTPAQY